MKHNYHAHTPWSHHSSITMEDSILEAIKKGFKTFGFSEHVNLEGSLEGYRMRNKEDLEGFLSEAKEMKQKYKDKIEILIGLEIEYRNETTDEIVVDEIKKMLIDYSEIEYLLYAGHWYGNGKHIFTNYPEEGDIKRYLEDMRKAVQELDIKYIVHPDGWTKGMQIWNEISDELTKGIIDISLEFDIPLGLNSNGLGYGLDFCYPHPKFWTEVGKRGAKTILELDSHSLRGIGQDRMDYISNMAKELKLNVIDKLDI